MSTANGIKTEEYLCRCGVELRVDFEVFAGPGSVQEYQHACGKDKPHDLLGPIIASWEERDGIWVRTGKYR